MVCEVDKIYGKMCKFFVEKHFIFLPLNVRYIDEDIK